MKKIIFSDIPMKDKSELDKHRYPVDGNSTIEYDGEVVFPVNAVLAKTLKEGDEVKVVLLAKSAGDSEVNVGEFQRELNEINSRSHADISYVTLYSPFEETRGVHEELFKKLVAELEENAEIIADITYGPKPLPIILFALLNFAEKFFNCEIKNIVYGKVDHVTENGKKVTKNPMMYDLTPLYYLNAVTNSMECESSSSAVKALNMLLSI